MKKNVLITGASTGIGEQAAKDLAHADFHVYAGIRNEADGEKLKAHHPQNITPILLDVTKHDQIQKAFEHIQSKGALWGLINNAGIVVAGPLEFLTVEDLREQFEVNVFGLHQMTRIFLPLLRESKGRIIHIGSISGKFAFPFIGPYCASKHAVEALADSLRREIYHQHVSVSLIEPGRVLTPIWEKSKSSNRARLEKLTPVGASYYGRDLVKIESLTSQAGAVGSPSSRVSKAILHALNSKCPKTRYLVGLDAHIENFMARFFPDRLTDWIVQRLLNS